MKLLSRVAPILLAVAFSSLGQAQIFYNNYFPSRFPGAFPTSDELADDTPFTGTQHVGSFTFAYSNPNAGPVSAIARFYSVAATGGVGNLVATVPLNNLPPGPFQFFTANLEPGQQFDWVATPGVYGIQGVSGGFFSLQFSTPNCGWQKSDGPASLDGFYDVTTGQFITFQGDPTASFYLQVANSSPFPALAINILVPVIFGSEVDTASVTIYPVRTKAVTLQLLSSRPGVARVPATITIPAGTMTVDFPIFTKAVAADTAVAIVVRAPAGQKVAKLTVTAH